MPADLTISALFVPLATVAAAIVAGGIALSNLVVSKETKVSEFRQAWNDSLRSELTALLSSTRIMARALQEDRANAGATTKSKYQFPEDKVVALRQAAAEMHHMIKLRLNARQADHSDLIRLLATMMATQQKFFQEEVEATDVIDSVERAAEQAAVVLKREWEAVKLGEPAYRRAVATSKLVLLGAALMLIVVLGYAWRLSTREIGSGRPMPASASPIILPSEHGTSKENLRLVDSSQANAQP